MAAMEGAVMSLYRKILSRDYHIHTRLSVCSLKEMTVRNIIRRAERRGYTELGISDHLGGYTEPADLRKTRAKIARVETDVTVFLGCEMNIHTSGEPVFAPEEVDFLDYVMVGVDHVAGEVVSAGDDPLRWLSEWVGRAERLIEWPGPIDIIAHPLRTLLGYHKGKPLLTHVPWKRWEELLGGLARRGTAIELEDAVENYQTVYDVTRRFYGIARGQGMRFSAASDSHGLDRLGFQVLSVPLADDLGLRAKDLFSARRLTRKPPRRL